MSCLGLVLKSRGPKSKELRAFFLCVLGGGWGWSAHMSRSQAFRNGVLIVFWSFSSFVFELQMKCQSVYTWTAKGCWYPKPKESYNSQKHWGMNMNWIWNMFRCFQCESSEKHLDCLRVNWMLRALEFILFGWSWHASKTSMFGETLKLSDAAIATFQPQAASNPTFIAWGEDLLEAAKEGKVGAVRHFLRVGRLTHERADDIFGRGLRSPVAWESSGLRAFYNILQIEEALIISKTAICAGCRLHILMALPSTYSFTCWHF